MAHYNYQKLVMVNYKTTLIVTLLHKTGHSINAHIAHGHIAHAHIAHGHMTNYPIYMIFIHVVMVSIQ